MSGRKVPPRIKDPLECISQDILKHNLPNVVLNSTGIPYRIILEADSSGKVIIENAELAKMIHEIQILPSKVW